uniref:Uncharacterized protein n=1 Tax=Setaria viridis TaxID=4556 RepID=A0A4U6V0V3_SETVI|nr:hypothetical protein SEVIR_4G163700v2 [Setaria viridis]
MASQLEIENHDVVNNRSNADDNSDISDYKEDNEATETDYEESSYSNINALTYVPSSTLLSCHRTIDGMENIDDITDVNDKGNVLVVAGCRMCMLYIMIHAGNSVCFRCGNSNLIHFGGNGQA